MSSYSPPIQHYFVRNLVEFFYWLNLLGCVGFGIWLVGQSFNTYGGTNSFTLGFGIGLALFGPLSATLWRGLGLMIIDTHEHITELNSGGQSSVPKRSVSRATPAQRATARPARAIVVPTPSKHLLWWCPACNQKNDGRNGYCMSCGNSQPES